MKTIYQVLCLLCFVALSCENRESIIIENLDTNNENLGYVSLNRAKSVADMFISTHTKNEKKSARVGTKEIKETIIVNDSIGVPAFYIINYKDNAGFNIISAERKVFPILAFNDSGNFHLDDEANGVSLWSSNLKSMINFIRKNKDVKELKGATAQWEQYNKTKPNGRSNNEPVCDDCFLCEDHIVNNLISTEWGQGEGYNATCPVKSGGECGRAPTGCVATSMMQVMRYHSFPTFVVDSYHPGGSVNWSIMPNTFIANHTCSPTSGQQELSQMMRSVGESVNMNYGATSSGAMAWNVAPAFKNQYFFDSSTDRLNFSGLTVMSELDSARPVILDGGSHMWVTSGYQYLNTPDCYQAYLYLYMNWGWDGRGNGFFASTGWSVTINTTNYDFNSNKKMTVVRK